MDTSFVRGEIAHLLGLLFAIKRGRSSWSELETRLAGLIAYLSEQDASTLRNRILEELQLAAEHAREGHHRHTYLSVRAAAQHIA